MATSGLYGPFSLTGAGVLAAVSSNGSPGAYALGKTNKATNTFEIAYVGRSDSDIAARLQSWVGSYAEFKFDYFTTAAAAFTKECHLYHDFNPPGNTIHPARPQGSYLLCPRCGQ
jgi:hypothetical protein